MISNYSFNLAKDGRISDVLIETSRFTRIIKDTTISEKIGISDFQILLLLRERESLSIVQLANLLCKAPSNIVPSVKKLELSGYVSSCFAVDGRSKQVAITEKGLEYAAYLTSKAKQKHDKFFKYSI